MSSVPRFFVAPSDITGEMVTLPADAAHHARNVLRLRVGEEVVVHDGTGTAYRCRLESVAPDGVIAEVLEGGSARTEPAVRITIAQALPKTPDKVEQVLQHGTEVGASGFVLWGAKRSVARIESGDKLAKRLERWRSIVRGAAEQSGRAVLPAVSWLPTSAALVASFDAYDAVLTLHEAAVSRLHASLVAGRARDASTLLVIIGPEGGLADEEGAAFAQRGASAVSLGPRVLRTETAALVALAQILYARDAG